MKLAIIPARGGSKRIPKKNIKLFAGRPIIAYSIMAALESESFDRVIVSTDDREIREIAKRYGAEVPFLRPQELSDDHSGTTPVIIHAIQHMLKIGHCVDEVCCIYPTAPMIASDDIQKGLELLIKEKPKFVFSATSYPFPIQRAFRINNKQNAELLWPENHFVRSQDLIDTFHDAGQFYWGSSKAWINQTNMYDDGAMPLLIPRHRAQDIDTLEDWVRAEYLFTAVKVKP